MAFQELLQEELKVAFAEIEQIGRDYIADARIPNVSGELSMSLEVLSVNENGDVPINITFADHGVIQDAGLQGVNNPTSPYFGITGVQANSPAIGEQSIALGGGAYPIGARDILLWAQEVGITFGFGADEQEYFIDQIAYRGYAAKPWIDEFLDDTRIPGIIAMATNRATALHLIDQGVQQ